MLYALWDSMQAAMAWLVAINSGANSTVESPTHHTHITNVPETRMAAGLRCIQQFFRVYKSLASC